MYYNGCTLGIISPLTVPIIPSDLSVFAEIIAANNTNAISDDDLKIVRKYYDIRGLSITYITPVFLLLTFGVAYPLLALLLLISVTLQTLVLQVSIHNHYLQVLDHPSLYKAWNKVLEIETKGFANLLSSTLRPSIALSSVFMVFFIIDMTWNEHTDQLYYVLPMVFILIVLLLFLTVSVIDKYSGFNRDNVGIGDSRSFSDITSRSNSIILASKRFIEMIALTTRLQSNSISKWPVQLNPDGNIVNGNAVASNQITVMNPLCNAMESTVSM